MSHVMARPGTFGRPRWLGIAALWFACGAFLTHQSVIFNRLRNPGTPIALGEVAFRDFVVVGVWLLVTPVVVALCRRYPIDGGARRLLLHAVAAAALGATHVTGVHLAIGNASGAVLSAENASLFGWDLFAYVVIAGWAHARGYAERAAERELTHARLAATVEQARWRAASARTHPEFLTAVLARLELMVFEDVPRAERVMEHLGDLLRAGVAAAERDAVTLRQELDLLEMAVLVARECSGATVTLDIATSDAADRAVLPPRFLRGLLDDLVLAAAEGDGTFQVRVEAHAGEGALRLRVTSSVPPSRDSLAAIVALGEPREGSVRWHISAMTAGDGEVTVSVRPPADPAVARAG